MLSDALIFILAGSLIATIWIVIRLRRTGVISIPSEPESDATNGLVDGASPDLPNGAPEFEGQPVQIIRGENDLKSQFEAMREQPGLRSIKAIWSADYGDIQEYFDEERKWLRGHHCRHLFISPPLLVRAYRRYDS